MWIETDGSESTLPVDASTRLCLDVGPASINRAHLPCGKDSENLFTFQSTKMDVESSIHILENSFFGVHIWGSRSLQN